jgi:large subunit ribosomal protein L32e
MINMDKRLIEVRREVKARKPTFVRSYFSRKKNLKKCWRKADGLHNKIRLCHRGQSGRVEVGYGSPREVRGLSREGLLFVTVANVSQLNGLDSKSQIVVISSTVGNKKRLAILSEAKKIGLKVYNYKDVDKKMDLINQTLKNSKKKSEDAKKRVEVRLKKTSKKEDKNKEETKEDVKKEDIKKEEKKKEEKKENKKE